MAAALVVASGVLIEVLNWEKSIFHMLTDFVIFAASIFYVLAVVGVLVLRRKHPEWPRSCRTLGYPVIPLLYVGFYTWFLGQVYLGKTFESNAGLLMIACGLPAFYGWQSWMSRRNSSERRNFATSEHRTLPEKISIDVDVKVKHCSSDRRREPDHSGKKT